MSRYYANYGQYLGAQRCCDLRGPGPQGPAGPTGPSAIGQRGFTGPTGSKSFIIDHPIDSEKYLVHTCLEGPEAGVYYRGMGEISNSRTVEIDLPHYVSSVAYEFTINITPIYDGKIHILNASMVENNKFTVYGDNCEFYWTVFGKRFDINAEPYKNSVNVRGDGPYLYI